MKASQASESTQGPEPGCLRLERDLDSLVHTKSVLAVRQCTCVTQRR